MATCHSAKCWRQKNLMISRGYWILVSIVLSSALYQHNGNEGLANAATVSENFILQLKLVPGYKMPDATEDQHHTKAFFASAIELFLTNALTANVNQNSKFAKLDIYKVEIHNQVIGKSKNEAIAPVNGQAATSRNYAGDSGSNQNGSSNGQGRYLRWLESSGTQYGTSSLRPLYVNMTISGEYTPTRKQGTIDSSEYQQMLLQLFKDEGGKLTQRLRDLDHIPYFNHVNQVRAVASSVLSSQAKAMLDTLEAQQQHIDSQKVTAAIAAISVGSVGLILLSVATIKIVMSRARYNKVTANDAKNDFDMYEIDQASRNKSYSNTGGPSSYAFDNSRRSVYPHDSIYTSSLSAHYNESASVRRPLSSIQEERMAQVPKDHVYNAGGNEKTQSYLGRDAASGYVNGTESTAGRLSTTSDDNKTRGTSSSRRSAATSYSKLRAENYDGVKRHCFAPPGKLGVAIEDGPVDIGPIVHKIKPGSSLEGILKSGDRIVCIDDIDTRELSAADVTKWMVEKMESRRKITYMTLKQGVIV